MGCPLQIVCLCFPKRILGGLHGLLRGCERDPLRFCWFYATVIYNASLSPYIG